jgi:hypothetical protein
MEYDNINRGTIGIYSLPTVPINLNVSISNDEPYNINVHRIYWYVKCLYRTYKKRWD